MMENNGQSDRALFEVNPIELGRFDPDSQDLDFILYQLVWNLDISDTEHCKYFFRKTISQPMRQNPVCLYITITLKVKYHNGV